MNFICEYCKKEFVPKLIKNKNRFCSVLCSGKFNAGEHHPNWKGGLAKKRADWVKGTFERFDNKCAICATTDQDKLVAHHIDQIRTNNVLKNGLLLCCSCHAYVHQRIMSKSYL